MEFKWYLLYSERDTRPDVRHGYERCISLELPNVEEVTEEDAVFAARNVWAGIVISRKPEERERFFNPRVSCQAYLSQDEELFGGIVGEEEDTTESFPPAA